MTDLADEMTRTVMQDAVKNKLREGKDQIQICHELQIRRFELGSLGFGTGPWTGTQWSRECRRRGYDDLAYVE
jgi:hypothetical protein